MVVVNIVQHDSGKNLCTCYEDVGKCNVHINEFENCICMKQVHAFELFNLIANDVGVAAAAAAVCAAAKNERKFSRKLQNISRGWVHVCVCAPRMHTMLCVMNYY